MEYNFCFDSNYNIEINQDLDSSLPQYYFPGGMKRGGGDGIIIKIIPISQKPWIGIFAFGEDNNKAISGIYTTPNPNSICVVSRGAGYIVSANKPEKWEFIKAIPIFTVQLIPVHKIIVFSNYTELIAYDDHGIKWCTERIALDGLKIKGIYDTIIKGEYWDDRNDNYKDFEVDILTGDQRGGIGDLY